MIDVWNIAVRKGGKNIIKRAALQIRPGRVSVIIGKNGAGKSTLLEALTGAHAISRGTIRWDGVELAQIDLQWLARRRAVLSQSVGLAFPMRVYDLVEMGAYVCQRSLSPAEKKAWITDALAEVEMQDFQDRLFHTLSGGEQKRVLLAKCIVQLHCGHQPGLHQYLFLDEPTSSLDIHQQFKLMELIGGLVRKRKIGVFAILHDINLAAQFADEILMIQAGEIIARGCPEQVLTPAIIEKTLGVRAIIRPHPIFKRPHVTTFPVNGKPRANATFINPQIRSL